MLVSSHLPSPTPGPQSTEMLSSLGQTVSSNLDFNDGSRRYLSFTGSVLISKSSRAVADVIGYISADQQERLSSMTN